MALRRVYVDWIRDETAGVSGTRAHHLVRVARLQPGEQVEISDAQRVFLAQVRKAQGEEVRFDVLKALPLPESPFPVVLQIALFKFPRLEWLIEKASELGVTSIVPVEATLSERGLVQAAPKRRARWERIAEEASQQSRRLAPPAVGQVVPFEQAVAATSGPLRFFLDSASPLLRDFPAVHQAGGDSKFPAFLLVGPEGGWTTAEREFAVAAGYEASGLGTGILRSETAAVAALSILAHLLPQQDQ